MKIARRQRTRLVTPRTGSERDRRQGTVQNGLVNRHDHPEPEGHAPPAANHGHGPHTGHDAHAAHDTVAARQAHHGHEGHDTHAGHSVEMFRQKFWGTLLLSIPTLVWGPMIQHWLGYEAPGGPGASRWISAVFGTLVFAYGGLVFVKGAAGELADRRPGMMTLIALAISVAFLFSLAVTLGFPGSDLWWELGGHGRARYLYALARHVQKNARLLAVLETLEIGRASCRERV